MRGWQPHQSLSQKSIENIEEIQPWLNRHPDMQAVTLLEEGFVHGFVISCDPPPTHTIPALQNLQSACQHPEIVWGKLTKEVALGHIAGPFWEPLRPNLVESTLGVV